MTTDIRIAIGFKNHRKRKRLTRLLGFGAEVYLIDLWLTAAIDCPKGILSGWDDMDIADACGWEKEPNILVDALLESKWLDEVDGVYHLHDWEDHQGWVFRSEERSKIAKKAAETRWKKRRGVKEDQGVHTKGNAVSMQGACGEHADSNAPSPSPSPSPTPTPMVNNNADSSESASRAPEKFYRTKTGKKLTGKRLESFEHFWRVFNYKKGKSASADSWLKIPSLTDALVKEIISAAEIEASRRPDLIKKGHSPKWAQGWLTERRWEDEDYSHGSGTLQPKKTMIYEVTE
ncbi:hypothetical protein [Desulfobacula toluolica]|uniref:Uncharacterized protein n=1 Tax=Desulfobacula toluolica (strain DSM 7467 / Tol2) TaxID=651182 RepID=K0NQG8_DESTT|nr:hypothetical protein [Desulfobacula toluolica]CCK82408.1 uncharacterized protein TOL2_C42520 [Desulfobacula toluolica Tol2]